MPTLYVENVPEELYRSLRKRARGNRKSIAAEVISLLEREIPTAAELKLRERFYRQMEIFRSHKPLSRGRFPTVEQAVREDRER
jgi:plasmid stability protein